MPRHKAFISYSSRDADMAREVEATLQAMGLETGSEDPEQATPVAIGEAISGNDLLVLLWSKHAAGSPLVEFAWSTALALHKKILPCRLDETPLQPSLAAVRSIGIGELKESIPKLLADPEPQQPDREAARVLLERLGTIPPGEPASMAAAATQLLHLDQSGDGSGRAGSDPDAATMLGEAGNPDPDSGGPVGARPASEGAASGSSDNFRVGQTVARRYELRRLLGQGGMGAVYQAFDTELDRDVALKVIKPEIASHPEVLERFKREIQLSSVVTHRNVLRVYDLGEADGTRFLTMQYVEGENLSDLMRREGKLDLKRVLALFRQICDGLKAAHDQGVIHRDLKPDNVMIDSSGQVLLTDFGLAKSMQQTAMTQAGQVMGTPDYMSPEQVKGEEADHRSDIYSLGAMLYELAAGQVPFSGNTVFEVMIQRTQREPESVTALNPEVPPFVERIVRRSMAREREARYASIDEMLRDLDRGMETGKSSFGGRFYWRRFTALADEITWKRFLIALPVIALLTAGSFSFLQRMGILSPPAAVTDPAAVAQPQRVLIADFVNMTGQAVFDQTLEQALSIGLEGASFLESFRRERARSVARELKPDLRRLDRDAARLVAQREGIDAVVTGSIEGNGQTYTLSVEAIEPLTGESLSRQRVSADGRENVLTALAQVAVEIRRALGDRASRAEMQASVETFTTSSLEAAQAYASAQTLQQQGKWQEAINRYQAAVELDPDMGRAYSGLAVMNFNLGRQEEADRYFLLAMSQLDRMTPRERYKTQGNYHILNRDYEKAVEAYTSLVEEVPGDSLGRANLAYAAFFARDFEGAYEQGKAIADANPGNVVMRANSAWYAMFAGDFETAEGEARKALELDDSFRQTYIYLALTQVARGEVDEARQTWALLQQQGAEGASLAAAGLADLEFFEGRFQEGIRLLDADLATPAPSLPGLKHTARASASLQLGRIQPALASTRQALSMTNKLGVVFEAALVHLESDNHDRALELAATLSAGLQLEDRAYGKLLEGESQRRRGNIPEAVRLFRDSIQLADTVMGRFLLGRAYLDGEEFPAAYSEFEQCLQRRGEFLSLFLDEAPTYRYFAPVYFYMGLAQEGLGSPASATSFQRFLDIRGDSTADPRVAQARSRLSTEN